MKETSTIYICKDSFIFLNYVNYKYFCTLMKVVIKIADITA